jgi:hypothetical protein
VVVSSPVDLKPCLKLIRLAYEICFGMSSHVMVALHCQVSLVGPNYY